VAKSIITIQVMQGCNYGITNTDPNKVLSCIQQNLASSNITTINDLQQIQQSLISTCSTYCTT